MALPFACQALLLAFVTNSVRWLQRPNANRPSANQWMNLPWSADSFPYLEALGLF